MEHSAWSESRTTLLHNDRFRCHVSRSRTCFILDYFCVTLHRFLSSDFIGRMSSALIWDIMYAYILRLAAIEFLSQHFKNVWLIRGVARIFGLGADHVVCSPTLRAPKLRSPCGESGSSPRRILLIRMPEMHFPCSIWHHHYNLSNHEVACCVEWP